MLIDPETHFDLGEFVLQTAKSLSEFTKSDNLLQKVIGSRSFIRTPNANRNFSKSHGQNLLSDTQGHEAKILEDALFHLFHSLVGVNVPHFHL